jgi:pSer/pThr/pTyr-binding forkhead associated (FHA) protein
MTAVQLALVVERGERPGARFDLVDDMIVGRVVGAGITLDDVEVSWHHAVIRVRADGADITDLGSTNGTFVNGERITSRVRLSPGSSIRVGRTELRLV